MEKRDAPLGPDINPVGEPPLYKERARRARQGVASKQPGLLLTAALVTQRPHLRSHLDGQHAAEHVPLKAQRPTGGISFSSLQETGQFVLIYKEYPMNGFRLLCFTVAFVVATMLGMSVALFGVDGLVPSVVTTWLEIIAVSLTLLLATYRLHWYPTALESQVEGHFGACVPVWLNHNQVDTRISGAGSGFFKKVLLIPGIPVAFSTGPEFHGYIRRGKVLTTEGIYGRLPC
jgi:hypothetical protein